MAARSAIKVLGVAGAVFIAACGGTGEAVSPSTQASEDFNTTLNGTSEVPAVTTTATGLAGFIHAGDSVVFSINLTNLSGVTSVKLHSGASNANGPERVTLYTTGTPTGTINGQLVKGVFKTAGITGATLDQLLLDLRNGNAYVNVYTSDKPTGAIRGQIGKGKNEDDPFFIV